MKHKIAIVVMLVLLFPMTSYAVKARKAQPYAAPTAVPATIGQIIYVTGLPSLDDDKYKRRLRYKGRFELGKTGAAFVRTRARQDGGRGVEDVDIARFRYSDVKKLYYGEDALKQIDKGALPTAAKEVFDPDWGVFVPLWKYVRRRLQQPVIIFYRHKGQTVSLVVVAHHDRAKALYQLLKTVTGNK